MKTWQDLFSEKPSKDYTDRVLRGAEAEMAKLAGTQTARAPGFFSRWSFVGSLATAAVAIVLFRNRDIRPRGADFDIVANDSEMLSHMDFFSELDTLEAWEQMQDEDKSKDK